MKNFAALLALIVPSFAAVSAVASPIAPGVDLSLTSGIQNYTFAQIVPGTFVFADGLSTVTAVYVGTPLGDTFNITDLCVSVGAPPCKQYALSITDTNFAGTNLGVGVSAYAAAHTSLSGDVANVSLTGSAALGSDTLVFSGAPGGSPANSPVPEPGTLSMMATGLLGAAAGFRRRFLA